MSAPERGGYFARGRAMPGWCLFLEVWGRGVARRDFLNDLRAAHRLALLELHLKEVRLRRAGIPFTVVVVPEEA